MFGDFFLSFYTKRRYNYSINNLRYNINIKIKLNFKPNILLEPACPERDGRDKRTAGDKKTTTRSKSHKIHLSAPGASLFSVHLDHPLHLFFLQLHQCPAIPEDVMNTSKKILSCFLIKFLIPNNKSAISFSNCVGVIWPGQNNLNTDLHNLIFLLHYFTYKTNFEDQINSFHFRVLGSNL